MPFHFPGMSKEYLVENSLGLIIS